MSKRKEVIKMDMYQKREIRAEKKKNESQNSFSKVTISWYPGHMTKAKRQMQEDIKLIDIVIELIDARLPISSRNPDIDELGKNKARLILMNKADLADNNLNDKWVQYFKNKGFFVVKINAKSGEGIKQINSIIAEACKEKIERDRRRGILNRPVRAMVVGIPNVGKSTFINSYAKKACTKTGNKPGVTKGKQWIKLNKNLELLDTPGILWPKFDDKETGIKLAISGSINDNILNITELSLLLIKFLMSKYPLSIKERYSLENTDDLSEIDILKEIANVRACKLKGNEPDIDKAANIIIDDFRSGKLGRITMEEPVE